MTTLERDVSDALDEGPPDFVVDLQCHWRGFGVDGGLAKQLGEYKTVLPP